MQTPAVITVITVITSTIQPVLRLFPHRYIITLLLHE